MDFDAIIIGAGVSGLYQLYKLRELGLTVRVFGEPGLPWVVARPPVRRPCCYLAKYAADVSRPTTELTRTPVSPETQQSHALGELRRRRLHRAAQRPERVAI